jgi:hypothetical protein
MPWRVITLLIPILFLFISCSEEDKEDLNHLAFVALFVLYPLGIAIVAFIIWAFVKVIVFPFKTAAGIINNSDGAKEPESPEPAKPINPDEYLERLKGRAVRF